MELKAKTATFSRRFLLLFLIFLLLSVILESWSLGGEKITSKTQRLEGTQRIYLTVDLCPSSKKYEKKLFDALEKLGHEQEKPIPPDFDITAPNYHCMIL